MLVTGVTAEEVDVAVESAAEVLMVESTETLIAESAETPAESMSAQELMVESAVTLFESISDQALAGVMATKRDTVRVPTRVSRCVMQIIVSLDK